MVKNGGHQIRLQKVLVLLNISIKRSVLNLGDSGMVHVEHVWYGLTVSTKQNFVGLKPPKMQRAK